MNPENPTKPLSGIRGWLLLPALGLVITPLIVGAQIFRDLLPALAPEVWNPLTDPASGAYHAMWAPTILFELITSIGFLAFTLWLLVLFFTKNARTPLLFIVWLVASTTIQLIDHVLCQSIPALANQPEAGDLRDLFRSFINAVVWIPYFLLSERVRNTFARRAAASLPAAP